MELRQVSTALESPNIVQLGILEHAVPPRRAVALPKRAAIVPDIWPEKLQLREHLHGTTQCGGPAQEEPSPRPRQQRPRGLAPLRVGVLQKVALVCNDNVKREILHSLHYRGQQGVAEYQDLALGDLAAPSLRHENVAWCELQPTAVDRLSVGVVIPIHLEHSGGGLRDARSILWFQLRLVRRPVSC
eukprot:scaffold5198_cov247-Pinguiococcus_pyrenoidosus.AAC.12